MKREHSDFQPEPQSAAAKGKMWVGEDEVDGMDELLAVLGYKVRTSDMADVALKLEQLEEAMMFNGPALLPDPASAVTDDNSEFVNAFRLLPDDTVHYNPSDLSTWLESMLFELNPPQTQPQPSDYDLKAIPGRSVLSPSPAPPPSKRAKPSPPSSSSAVGGGARPVVLVDSQENGVRLVHMLLACAEAVEAGNLGLAEALLRQIGVLAPAQVGAMGKVATYFAEALARRIYQKQAAVTSVDPTLESTLLMHFYESGPYLKFAHFTANQAILEAFEGKSRVHVIDFSMNQGMQWPALMQALALRPGGPPSFRLTGIGPPAPDNSDHLQEVGWKLAQLAETIHVEFEYRGFVASSLADLDADILELRPGESVAVNSVLELHRLLARPGALEKVLSVVRRIKPDIFTMVEQESGHNGPEFLSRFTESLHYYSTLFDSLDGTGSGCSDEDRLMSEMYLGRQISNVVGCEGADRVERHERLAEWRNRLGSAGFNPVCLGSNAFKQASMLLALFGGGDGYRVEESDGCLLLGWHTRPIIATSAWRVNSAS